ncbi:hypothetical protein PHET_12442, partial [Paragonimus heterotremus]
FLLIAPIENAICQKIIGKRFVDGQITVEVCELHSSGQTVIDGKRIGKHRLWINRRNKNYTPLQANAIHTFFIRELSAEYGRCQLNGYWGLSVYPD